MPDGRTVSPAASMPPSDGIDTDPPGHFSFEPKPKHAAQHAQTPPAPERVRRPLQPLRCKRYGSASLREKIQAIKLVRVERVTNPHHQTACLLARITGISFETADLLAHEVLWQHLHGPRVAGRSGGPTGWPDGSNTVSRAQEWQYWALPVCAAV